MVNNLYSILDRICDIALNLSGQSLRIDTLRPHSFNITSVTIHNLHLVYGSTHNITIDLPT
uniref:Uncharacterized protein n=1 Tax=viral metagenome TaxID=1070528 RepID=A0A6C0BP43_9ZZZZ